MHLRETILDNAAPGTGVLAGVLWLMEQFASQTHWWSVIPFGWISFIAFAFWIGQEAYHPNGRVKLFCRRVCSFGRFQNVITRYEYFSLGGDHGGEQQFVAIYTPFVFSKERSLDVIIRIKATIRSYLANSLRMRNPSDYEWMDTSFSAIHHVSEDRIEIPIAFIPTKSGNPGVYGDKSLSGFCFSEGTAHFIEIRLFSGRQRQKHTVQIFMPFTTDCNDPILGINSGRFLIFENEKLPAF